MNKHIDLVAYAHIIYGGLILLAGLLVLVVLVGGGLLAGRDAEGFVFITSGIGIVIAVILAILGLPSIIGGTGLLKRKPWSRMLIIVLSIIALFSFPIGTIIGAYSLYVLFQDDARAEFEYGGFR